MPNASSSPSQAATPTVGYDEFVDKRIAKTRAAVKTADLATGAVVLLAWLLVVLLVAAMADHWLVHGGLGVAGRAAIFGIGAVGALLYIGTRLGPTLLLRVNPLYAAKEIERESPELKNSLLNLLQLRGGPDGVAVQRTLERQAAERLAQTGDAPIDHTPLLRAAKLLLVLVAIAGAYIVLSPKDFFASAGRVLAPWAPIAAPSRVGIQEITPGETELAQGERLEVTAVVTGLGEGELVELVFTTADGRFVDRRIPMRPREGGRTFVASLPPGNGANAALGLQDDLAYRIEAGDARSLNYRVRVTTAPTIAPTLIRYAYPAYTGYSAREVEGVGDLRAIEGTRVTITAQANLPLESAQIDLGADGRPDARMEVEGQQAVGRITLRTPGHGDHSTSYVLRFTSDEGQANHNPSQYRVEVIADLRPECSLTEPEEPVLQVAVNQSVRIGAEARDPDFALKRVRLLGETEGRQVLRRDLLTGDGRGRFATTTDLVPEEVGLQPGQVLEYWIEATDNRTPQPGTGQSERQQLLIVGPTDAPARNDQQSSEGDLNTSGQGGQPTDGAGSPQDEQPPGDQSGQGANGQQPGSQDQPGSNPQEKRQQDGQRDRSPPEQPQQEGQQQGQQERSNSDQPQPDKANPGQSDPNRNRSAEQPEGEQGDGSEPPPGGLTGEGDEGGEQNDQPTPGEGAEGSGSSGSDQNQSAGGSQNSDRESAGSPQDNPSGGSGGGQSEPVPRDGSDDGSAFDRIQQWLENQQGDSSSSDRPSSDSNSTNKSGENQPSQDPSGDGQTRQADPDRSSTGNESEAEASGNPADQPGQSNDQAAAREGQGQEGSDQGQNQPRDRSSEGQPGEQAERSEQGPGAGSEDRAGQQSESSSSESGDRARPGESTDQNSGPREGTGSSGQNQSADQGAGQSADRGAGDSSGAEGSEQRAEPGTDGKPSDQQGTGSDTRESTDGEGNRTGNRQDGTPSDSPADRDSDTNQGDNSLTDNRGQGPQDGQGKEGQPSGPQELVDRGPNRDRSGEGTEIGGDAANLEYARKQTDLVLERLDEQLRDKEVDRELLDQLGWTEDDLRRFVDRWQSRKQRAQQRGSAGQAELDRALRSLGLKNQGPTATRKLEKDSLRDLNERARTSVPSPLRGPLEWFNRSVNAADPANNDR